MKLQLDDKNFEVYQLRGQDHLLVAVPFDYIETINSAIKEYGNIEDVPVDKTVRGIFLDNEDGVLELDTEGQQNDIVMNQLIIS